MCANPVQAGGGPSGLSKLQGEALKGRKRIQIDFWGPEARRATPRYALRHATPRRAEHSHRRGGESDAKLRSLVQCAGQARATPVEASRDSRCKKTPRRREGRARHNQTHAARRKRKKKREKVEKKKKKKRNCTGSMSSVSSLSCRRLGEAVRCRHGGAAKSVSHSKSAFREILCERAVVLPAPGSQARGQTSTKRSR